MTTTSTGALASVLAAHNPPNPAPTMTTRGGIASPPQCSKSCPLLSASAAGYYNVLWRRCMGLRPRRRARSVIVKLVKLLQATDVRVDRRVVDFMAAFESDEHALRVSTPRAPLFVISRRFFQFRIGYDVVLDPEDRTLVLQKRLDLCLRGGFLGVVAT